MCSGHLHSHTHRHRHTDTWAVSEAVMLAVWDGLQWLRTVDGTTGRLAFTQSLTDWQGAVVLSAGALVVVLASTWHPFEL